MTHYLCAWNDSGETSHTIIKHGQDAVEAWLQECLGSAGIGCPKVIVDQLSTLDDDAGHGGTPIQVWWLGDDYSFSITEITDLGVFKDVGHEAQRAWNWLNGDQFETIPARRAKEFVEHALQLLGMPVDG